MKRLSLTLFFGVLAIAAALAIRLNHDAPHVPSIEDVHAATHRIMMTKDDNTGVCSATSIGKHVLLTASHCVDVGYALTVDGRPAHLDKWIDDGNDHSLWFLSGLSFDHTVKVSMTPLHVGDDVFVFGNPAKLPDRYRRGYVSAFYMHPDSRTDFEDLLSAPTFHQITVYDINCFYGDSGAGIFNAHNELVAVASDLQMRYWQGDQFKLVTSNAFNFDQEQLAQAESY